MKNYWLTLLLFIPMLLMAQEEDFKEDKLFVGFVSGGMNATQIAGDLLAGYRKVGGTAGVGAFIMYSPRVSNSLELNYSMKGSQSAFSDKDPTSFVKFILDYVEIPIQVNYHEKDVAIFHGGFTVSRLIRQNTVSPVITIQQVNTKKWDIGATAGATFLIKRNFGLNLKATFSLTNVLDGKFTDGAGNVISRARRGGWFHNALSFRVFYIFR